MSDVNQGLEAICPAPPPYERDDLREERSAILEYCGGFSRPEAERRAGLSPSLREP